MKIRGTAQHVAEKYLQFARDAHTGGDPVAAENYLQHAEHYFRLIAAAQAAQALAQSGQQRPPGEGESGELDEDDDYSVMSDRFASPSERAGAYQQQQNGFQGSPAAPNAPQPYMERPQFESDNRSGQNERGGFPSRQDRQGNRFPDRGPRPDRQFGERNDGYRDNRQNRDNRPREVRPYRDPQSTRETGGENIPATALPSFITGEPKPIVGETNSLPIPDQGATTTDSGAPETGAAAFGETKPNDPLFQGRGRRRRLRSPYGYGTRQAAEEESEAPAADTIGDETSASE